MVGHMSLLRDVYGPFGGLNPGAAGLEDCGSPSTHLKTNKMITRKYLVRHFPSVQQPLERGELDHLFWAPGIGNPTDISTMVRSDMAPPLRHLESGHSNPRSS